MKRFLMLGILVAVAAFAATPASAQHLRCNYYPTGHTCTGGFSPRVEAAGRFEADYVSGNYSLSGHYLGVRIAGRCVGNVYTGEQKCVGIGFSP